MNITDSIRRNWMAHLFSVFGIDAMFVNQNLPAFTAYLLPNGTIRTFAGKATTNEREVLERAVTRYIAEVGTLEQAA